ncbi:hypothetical protein B0A80_01475 [Flavobacterium tructae]|uniref:hypothetical protein n=1 Tax=Flavobacterium TaxID=237 RepID=UPI000B5B7284|nr:MULTISPECIES: hypothetical protein [Flavobacterium]OXB25330.1 hypothetical protein B0A80_01475 [Flavobacterium tructae]URC11762.1 hypothetical protein M4I44_16895 [Flavobacterium sp. B183]
MPKIKCVCGNIIGLGEIPSPNQYLMISDVLFDKFQGYVDAEEIYKEMKLVVHCKECQRLHIYCNGFDKDAIIYQICQ